MILFWIICAILVALALAFILPPLLQTQPLAHVNSLKEANVAVYREELAEMESARQRGNVPHDQYEFEREGARPAHRMALMRHRYSPTCV